MTEFVNVKSSLEDDKEALANFIEYLRIPSVQPDVDYEPCVNYLKRQAKGLGLPIQVFTVVPKKPVVIITWEGTDPTLPSVILNSHMDVVPVFAEKWTHDPFGAERDAKGNIYARGTQDMKSVGIQYLEAIRRLIKAGTKLRRTVHVSFVPDEEIGGKDGMAVFVNTIDFQNLNVGFALDEGMASEAEEIIVFYGERCIWQVHVQCPGTPGHGSLILPDTAGEKLRFIIDKFMDYRQKEKERLAANPKLMLGDVTTINLTLVQGGVQANVVPPALSVTFDVRIATHVDLVEFETMLWQWCKEAGPGVKMDFVQKGQKVDCTKLDESNPWWIAFKKECDAMKLQLKPAIFPAATDSRYIRQVGLPALGFSPINNTPVLLHDHDEFINEGVFLRGINIYTRLIPAVANVPSPAK